MSYIKLPHFKGSVPGSNRYEPVYKSTYEFVFTRLPNLTIPDVNVLIEHITQISGLDGFNPQIQTVEQKFKYVSRTYLTVPSETAFDVTMVFNMNTNNANENYVYNTLRQSYKSGMNLETGYMGLKKDYYCTGILYEYTRDGQLIRQVDIQDAIITAITGFDDVQGDSSDLRELSLTLRIDDWTERNQGEVLFN